MSKLNSMLNRFINDPMIRFGYLSELGLYNRMSDKPYLKKKYRLVMGGKELNLENPQTFDEKIQWLKLYNRKPEYPMLVDKYRVREYIAERLGEQYLVPLIGVWNEPDEIDFDSLPNQFVLKCNHNSGKGMCICRDKSLLDINNVKRELKKGLKQNYYWGNREWAYKDVKPCIIGEKYISDESMEVGNTVNSDISQLVDYKIHCFDGEPRFIQCIGERNMKTHEAYQNFYDLEWNKMTWHFEDFTDFPYEVPKPYKLEEMIECARRLSQGFPYVRIDMYSVNQHVYFGEITLYPAGGFYPYRRSWTEEKDRELGEMLNLPKKTGADIARKTEKI